MGKTLEKIKYEIDGQELTCVNTKKYMKYFPVPKEESWRLEFLTELLQVEQKKRNLENLSDEDVSTMIRILCTS